MSKDDLNLSINTVRKFKLVFLGDQSVGKSSIIYKYVYDTFESASNPTIGVDFVVKTLYYGENTYKIHFWDTAGQERFKSLIPSYIKDCQVAVIVYDITNKMSFDNVDEWYNSIKNESLENVKIGLLGNKVDCDGRKVSAEEGKSKADKYGMSFYECSAKTGENLTLFFKQILEALVSESESSELTTKNEGKKLNDASVKQKPEKGCSC